MNCKFKIKKYSSENELNIKSHNDLGSKVAFIDLDIDNTKETYMLKYENMNNVNLRNIFVYKLIGYDYKLIVKISKDSYEIVDTTVVKNVTITYTDKTYTLLVDMYRYE